METKVKTESLLWLQRILTAAKICLYWLLENSRNCGVSRIFIRHGLTWILQRHGWRISCFRNGLTPGIHSSFGKSGLCLVIDKCSGHAVTPNQFSQIRIVFLPPNATSVAQPCDEGIIYCFKRHYRHIFIKKVIDQVESGLARNSTSRYCCHYSWMHWLRAYCWRNQISTLLTMSLTRLILKTLSLTQEV